MFLFAQETKTPVSTYTDSYRPPNSVKKIFQEPSARLWKENKFVTKGLAIPPVPSPTSPDQQEKLLKAAAQEFAYRNAVEPSAYLPEKYWVTRQEERYNPVFVNEDRYVTWRTSPYNSGLENKYTTYLPRLPKEVKMEALLESTARPEHLHRCDGDIGPPDTTRHLHPLAERAEYPVLPVQPRSNVLCTFMQPAAILPVYEP
ncbi:PREDICTED: spermatid-specific manchette-related protein 1 [Tinamus guttatus]|uniref:spermatid-specific manchette-related protein 1 n=1 Tax=Tinamus guttatus TaxID=94827 RepID=UPI00052F1FE0|nr:PREDICTED: spermatid-specific manchette-related protein 1 [Tinamus guttatus]